MNQQHPTETFATVVALESAQASAADKELTLASRIGLEPVVIEHGFVQLRFDHGTLLVIEGPARFALLKQKHVKLDYGRAVATVPEAGHGFIIESPDAEIIDLGTQYGVEVMESGKTEVHVMQYLNKYRKRVCFDYRTQCKSKRSQSTDFSRTSRRNLCYRQSPESRRDRPPDDDQPSGFGE